MEGPAKPDNLLKGGASEKGRLELVFEKPGRVQGIVEVTPESGSERVRSMLWLIDVAPPPQAVPNNAGGGAHTYAPLEHAEWHGWTITDVVFPSFLWIVGVALTFSLAKRMASGAGDFQTTVATAITTTELRT